MEQAPVGLRETQQQFADFEMIAGHGADLRHQFLADVFGDGLLVGFGGEVVAALGRVFVEGTLEEVQGVIDLALELTCATLGAEHGPCFWRHGLATVDGTVGGLKRGQLMGLKRGQLMILSY